MLPDAMQAGLVWREDWTAGVAPSAHGVESRPEQMIACTPVSAVDILFSIR